MTYSKSNPEKKRGFTEYGAHPIRTASDFIEYAPMDESVIFQVQAIFLAASIVRFN
jgi:hypothetical protein